MSADQSVATYTLVGGEETFRNKLNQSPGAMRRLENLIPSVTGELEQKSGSQSFAIGGETITEYAPYRRVESDGSVTRMMLAATASGKVFKFVGAGTSGTEIFPAATKFPVLKQTPVFVQANNNLMYFTDAERWYCTDGTSAVEGGLPHPCDAPTFTTGAGVLNVKTNRFYWVSWADIDAGEFLHWGNSSPKSAGTGALVNKKVTITRPNHPPPRASHWMLFASETDGDAVFGALLGIIPIATTTFEDQSPFLDEAGTAMVQIRRPIRNGPMIPGNYATLHKGRIFSLGFNRVPVIIRNPSFDDPAGATLNGWTQSLIAQEVATANSVTTFDGAGALQLTRVAGVSGQGNHALTQNLGSILKPGRRYVIEVAGRRISSTGPTGKIWLRYTDGVALADLIVVSPSDPAGTWTRTKSISFNTTKAPSTQTLEIFTETLNGVDAIDALIDFIRVWEVVPPSNVAYSALEEVEGLQNGRGEESFPGSVSTPFDEDASDVVNMLTYPQEASELVSAVSFSDGLLVLSDTTGVPMYGSSFDDFGFSEQTTLSVGAANRFAVARSRHGLFFASSDLKVFKAPLTAPVQEISLPLRDSIAQMDSSQDVHLQVYDYGRRSWLVLTYAQGGTRKCRLFELETSQWFSFTEWTNPRAIAAYEPVSGKRVLLVSDGGSTFVVDDPLAAYSAGGTVPQGLFRQALFDMADPASWKVWKEISIHTTGTPSGTFWTDPADPDSPGVGITIAPNGTGTPPEFGQISQLTELYRAFLAQATDAYGKRLLLEVTLPSGATGTQKKILGLEVVAASASRHAP